MPEFELFRIPYFLLADVWKEDGVEGGRISFAICSHFSLDTHEKLYNQEKDRLLAENDDKYSRWVFTSDKYSFFGGATGHVTVFHFRIRDAY
ncbi:MAG TPA: hypothetical protein HPP51_03065 [Planctomycetes bacterium]|nr:hypothetical protein [Planctomycetota bacterium]